MKYDPNKTYAPVRLDSLSVGDEFSIEGVELVLIATDTYEDVYCATLSQFVDTEKEYSSSCFYRGDQMVYVEEKAPETPVGDVVHHPSHYELPSETIDLIRRNLSEEEFRGYCRGNILKYVCRAGLKNGEEDWQKAAKYFEFMGEEE